MALYTEGHEPSRVALFLEAALLKCPTGLNRRLVNFKIREIEAADTCQWLRATGFPQYAQMFEEGRYPIDLELVQKDHDFLDQDLLDSVTRRLKILNKCASMKIEAPIHRSCDESEDEDQCAISIKWKYMRSSRRWSRRMTGEEFPELELSTSPLVDSTTTHIHTHSRLNSSHESVTTTDSERNEGYTSTSSFESPAVVKKLYVKRSTDIASSPSSQSLPVSNSGYKTSTPVGSDGNMNGPRSAIIQISSPISVRKDAASDLNGLHSSRDHMKGAKSFLKRLDSLKGRRGPRGGSHRRKHKSGGDTLEISGPIVQDNGTLQRKIELFNCVDLQTAKARSYRYPANSLVTPPAKRRRNPNGRSNNTSKRMGRVFSEPSSPTLHRKFSLDVSEDLENALSKKINNNNESKSCEDVFMSDMDDVSMDIRDNRIPSERSSNVTGTTGRSLLSSSSNDSWQGQYEGESDDWPSQRLITSPLNSLEDDEHTPHRLRSPSMYDNMPPALHSSLDNLPNAEIEVAETELMRQIYNLKNIGHLNDPLAFAPSTRRSVSVSTCEDISGSHVSLNRTNNNLNQDVETEKLDILTNISKILMKEKQLVEPKGGACVLAPKPVVKRDRSNSLPNAGPEGIRESMLSNEVDLELEAEVMGLSSELERLLTGINESIHELEENIKKAETGDSSASTASSQISSPVTSPVNSPVNSQVSSPYGSPLPSPITTPDFNHNKREVEHQDDTGVGLSTGQDTTSEHDTPASNEEEDEEEEEQRTKSQETTINVKTGSGKSPWKERRDSGVGNSLTRPNSARRPRIRWHSFQKSHRPSLNSRPFQVSSLSVGQLMILRKLSLLKLTAVMERYSVSHRSGWTWMVPRFMKRTKTADIKDRLVFGVPLLYHLQKTGQPLPQTILYAMRYLRRQAGEAVGLFRKPGVRSRIQALKKMNEANPDTLSYDGMMAYDVADMLKQYFRELPEPLLTPKLSETFISLFTSSVPKELRVPVMQAAILLMPDENREVLQSLLLFLSDIASQADVNQMTAYNLAVCFAPSLFQLNSGESMRNPKSPHQRRKMAGKPDQKELIENVAANECLALMIRECKKLFMVPEDLLAKCHFSYMDLGEPVTLEELGRKRNDESGDYKSYLESCIQGLLKESREKFKGWVSCPPVDKVEVAYKKVGDGHPLRLWKCTTEIKAPPSVILQRVLRERQYWDEDLLKWRSVEKIDNQTEVFEYVVNSMAPHPTRSYTVLRSWRTNLQKGACVLVSTSIEHPDSSLVGSVRGTELASRFLIEPCGSGKSRLTHISRVDTKGRTLEWYNKAYGHLLAQTVAHIRNLYIPPGTGPETKV
ncbi:rho GTPase-activating protein 7 isoform X2 [Strongylocentrotus purpuratus]|uniref:Rho GTPase-activating protein 7 n=1 Tax=Strongylocentrotus purpuratus TaxID=7668 RepID=A0A7M7NLY7_STRPU|nr:rho GTPase-activating protein 7 isoform X2 [Strongylocentrotus purpuratus]